MRKISEKNEMIDWLLHVDECVRRWEYTSIYAGTSSVFALFLVFLKCMDDRAENAEVSYFLSLAQGIENRDGQFENIQLSDFCDNVLNNSSSDNHVFELFIKRIDMGKASMSFKKVLDVLEEVDFKSDKKVLDLIEAIRLLYGDVYVGLDIYKHAGQMDSLVMSLTKEMLESCENCDVYGFSCGTGVLLSLIAGRKSRIYAQEADLEKAIVAYILLRLESDNLEGSYFEIQIGDVLDHPMTLDMPEKQFDRIVVELPLGKRKSIADKLRISEHMDDFLFPDHPIDTGAWLYVRHVMKKLKKDGRAIVVAGINELSRDGNSRKDRESLLAFGAIDAVIQLPAHSITGNKLCMIVLQERADRQEVYMADLSNIDQLITEAKCSDSGGSTNINYEQIMVVVSEKVEKKE